MAGSLQLSLFSADVPQVEHLPCPMWQQRATAETMRLCVLGSGSGGNCTVIEASGQVMLLDAGFGPRTTGTRLAQAGLTVDTVRSICLTHLDRDHFRPTWVGTLLQHRIRLHLHHWHLPDLEQIPGFAALKAAGLIQTFSGDAFEPIAGVVAHGFRCQHDMQGTISYRLQSKVGAIGYATDLGHVPQGLIEHLAGVDVLAIESNYDEQMTIHSARPSFVNRRNMSDSGHLSNDQAFMAVRDIDAASPGPNPRHVVLLHRSSQCNHPMKVRRTFDAAPRLSERIILIEQRRRTRWVAIKPLPLQLREQTHWRF